jgi:hypothetical protein
MADEGDVLTEQIMFDDSQAISSLSDLVTGVTALNDKFIMLLGTLGEAKSGFSDAAEGAQELNGAESEGTDVTNAFTGAMEKAGMALQVAFGLGVYQIVNGVINLIKGGVQDGIDFAQSMFLINSAIDEMRGAGVDVQFQNLSNIVTDLGPKLQAFSNLDLSKAVGQVAALGGQFGATADEISTLTEFSAVASERMGGDIATNAQTITAALENMTIQMSRRILTMTGAEISAQEIYNEAVQLGIDNGAKTYQNLTDEEKLQAGITLIEQRRAQWQQWEAEYQSTAVGKTQDLGAAWQNLWTGWGIAITNDYPALVNMFDFVIGSIAVVSGYLETEIEMVKDLMGGKWTSPDEFFAELKSNINQVYDLYTNPPPTAVKGSPTASSTTPLGTPAGTTTGATQADITKIEEDGIKKVVDLHDQEAADLEKIQTDLGNKLVDITTKYNRDLAAEDVDAANQRQKIYDDTANTLATDASKQQLQSLEAEQKYQEEMQTLTDSFQANLLDALRENDAKTIIHLIEEYDNQKAEKTKQYNDSKVISDENYQQEINDVKKQEAFKLQELQDEVDQRKAALAVQYQQEQDDAKLQADRQATAEQVTIDNNLKQWGNGLNAQYELTVAQMSNIYNAINAYLGPHGFVDNIYTYITARMAQVLGALATYSTGGGTSVPTRAPGMASGGSIFANKPTDVTFGEAGPELAMFIPLGSNFGGASAVGGAGGGGSIQLQITLDPNLQAQIVQTSLNNVSLAIDRMQRQN